MLNWWVPSDAKEARELKQATFYDGKDKETGLGLKKKFGTYENMFNKMGFEKGQIKIKMYDPDDPVVIENEINVDENMGFILTDNEKLPRGYIPKDFEGTIYLNKKEMSDENVKWSTIAHELEHLLNSSKGFGRSEAKTEEGHFANVTHFPYKRPKDTDKIPKGIQSKLPEKKKGEK